MRLGLAVDSQTVDAGVFRIPVIAQHFKSYDLENNLVWPTALSVGGLDLTV